ncbi:MAG: hypothetical protein KAQ66_06330, partial [Rhodospirillaceae bacterium]|nr:hypothetical protein [Rhodospirillaceae bacterium]
MKSHLKTRTRTWMSFIPKAALAFGVLALVLVAAPLVLDAPFASDAWAAEVPATAEAVTAEGTPEASPYPPAPTLTKGDYPSFFGINGRVFVWIAAQLHLWFAAFVLAVPIFV